MDLASEGIHAIIDILVFIFCTAVILVLTPLCKRHWAAMVLAICDWFERERIPIEPVRISLWMTWVNILTALILFILLRSVVASLLGLLMVWLLPGWILAALQYRRRVRFNQQFVDVLLLMANSLRSGFNLSQAIEIVSNEMPAPASEEFQMVKRERELGASMENALQNLDRRMQSESMTIFVTAILVTLRTGGNLAQVLDKLVKTIRDRERCEDKIRTMTAEGRGQGYIIAALPVLMLAARYFFNPEGVLRLFHTSWGLTIIITGVTFNIAGLLFIQKCAKVKV
ncbi:MAG: hypothetical protein EOM12_04195 [Verrucomicrobiae bacterium]|nr:hypothetical protein [Verrucomicrobiae bacterium]